MPKNQSVRYACSCGRGFVLTLDPVLTTIRHADRWGKIWTQHNEVHIVPVVRPGRRGSYPRPRHVGTFPTFEDAKRALVNALKRSRH